jgi:nucleoside-diphosphate-sugar epimerase
VKVLVTGGRGFIGRHLVRKLVERGDRVTVFDNHFRDHGAGDPLGDIAREIHLIEGDIRDRDAVERTAAGQEVLYHLACINGTEFFYTIPDQVVEVAILGTYNAIRASISAGVRRFVFASSSEAYQTPARIPTAEDAELRVPDVLNPRYSYGGGKLAGELLTVNLLRKAGPEFVIFRPHNIYGPAMGFEHVIPQLCFKLREATREWKLDSAELKIQGSGDETRAFCFVSDAVDGIVLAAERGAAGAIYHVGVQQETSIRELVHLIAAVRGVKITVLPGPLMPGSTPRRCPDVSRLAALGYKPQVDIREGVRRTAEWYFQQPYPHDWQHKREERGAKVAS